MEQKENRVVLRGTAAGEATLSHQVHGLDFYRFPLSVPRLSGREDRLNILLPAPPEGKALPQPGDYLEVTGEVRSFNNRSGVGSRLVITVLARSVLPGVGEPCNQVWLRGTLCKPRSYGVPRWDGTSATCCWRSTAGTVGRITYPASPGGGWHRNVAK